jgi:hypothetical protein
VDSSLDVIEMSHFYTVAQCSSEFTHGTRHASVWNVQYKLLIAEVANPNLHSVMKRVPVYT